MAAEAWSRAWGGKSPGQTIPVPRYRVLQLAGHYGHVTRIQDVESCGGLTSLSMSTTLKRHMRALKDTYLAQDAPLLASRWKHKNQGLCFALLYRFTVSWIKEDPGLRTSGERPICRELHQTIKSQAAHPDTAEMDRNRRPLNDSSYSAVFA